MTNFVVYTQQGYIKCTIRDDLDEMKLLLMECVVINTLGDVVGG